jgi:hypothetical protein
MDSRCEFVFAVQDGLTNSQLWQRPAPSGWQIGTILSMTMPPANVFPAAQVDGVRWRGNGRSNAVPVQRLTSRGDTSWYVYESLT